ncbi:hypothetical protein [Streptomyces anulatus]|uniref:hypothetical protein n=1 Tax=Streptomyces anulatus TaxID=1892 RepID=UPI0034381759
MPQNPTPAAAGDTNPTTPTTPEREAEIRETHPGSWYEGRWTQEYIEAEGGDPAYYRVVHHESGTTLATLPDFAGGIALFIADARDAVPELLATLDQLRDDITGACLARHEEEQENAQLRARVAELEAQAKKVTAFAAQRAEYVTSILNCHPDNAHDYYRWQGHAESRRQLSERLGLPVAWPAETEPRTAPAPVEDEDSHEAKVAEYLSTPYTDDFPSQREAGAL